MFIIIQHLCAGIECDKIRIQVHKAMHKEILWTLLKSTKDIKTINNISLPLCGGILKQSFGYQILQCINDCNMNHNISETRKKNDTYSLCSRTRYCMF